MSREESITMAELNRYEGIKSLLDGKLTNKEAGRSLQLTVRQIQRIKKRVFGEGVRGVFHGNKGRKPLHAFSAEFKGEAMDLFKRKYFDFNFSHLSDYLFLTLFDFFVFNFFTAFTAIIGQGNFLLLALCIGTCCN